MMNFSKLTYWAVIFSVSALGVSTPISTQAQTRNTLWLDGLSVSSLGWGAAPRDLRLLEDYDLRNVVNIDDGLPGSIYQPELGVLAAADYLESQLGGEDDVLGISHDYGGLVMRALANGDSKLSAMILCGVPNRGSRALEFAIRSTGTDSKSAAQRMIDGVLAIRGSNECEAGCSLIEMFGDWIDELKSNEEVVGEMLPDSDALVALTQASSSQVPHVVFWGSVDEFAATSFMNSYVFGNNLPEDYITKCYDGALKRWKERVDDERRHQRWDAVFGLFNDVKDSVADWIAEGLSWSNALTNAGSLIEGVVNWLNANDERERELDRILRCETANQLLALKWELELMEAGDLSAQEVQVTVSNCYQFCAEQTSSGNSPFGGFTPAYNQCLSNCLTNPVATTVTVLVPEPNDGLLNRSEQLLEGGAVAPYHLSRTNHFQETSLYYEPPYTGTQPPQLLTAFEDLFDGAAGAAFAVPKQ